MRGRNYPPTLVGSQFELLFQKNPTCRVTSDFLRFSEMGQTKDSFLSVIIQKRGKLTYLALSNFSKHENDSKFIPLLLRREFIGSAADYLVYYLVIKGWMRRNLFFN